MQLTERQLKSLWSRIDKRGPDECWNWTRKIRGFGYGVTTIYANGKSKDHSTHRLVYFLANPDGDRSLCVLHKCDNPRCCNPNHLFLGTRAENIADMMRKNRHWQGPERCRKMKEIVRKGERAWNAKLTEEIVRFIREEYNSKRRTLVSLSKEFGVSMGLCSGIVHRTKWAHVV